MLPQVDRGVDFSQQSVAVKAVSPKSSQMTCKCIQILWPVQPVSRSNLLFLCACSVDQAVSPTAQQLFSSPPKKAKHDGRCCPPCLLLEISGVCIDGYPLLTSRATSCGETRKCEARWHTDPDTLRHVGGHADSTEFGLMEHGWCFCSCVFAISDSWVQMALPSAEHTHTLLSLFPREVDPDFL